MTKEKRPLHFFCAGQVRANPLLTFESRAQEDAFKRSYQAGLSTHILIYAMSWLALNCLIQLPFFRGQQQSGFDWSSDDPRTLYFASKVVVLLMGFLLCVLSKLPSKATKLFNIEIIFVGITTLHIIGLIFLTPWRLATYFNLDYTVAWPGIPSSVAESEMVTVLGVVVTSAVMTQFVNLRVRLLLIPNVAVLISYVASMTILGSPLAPNITRGTLGLLTILVLCSWLGAWRNENYAREKFLSMESAGKDLHTANIHADEAHQAFVSEKVKRFEAERSLQQFQGTWSQTALGAADQQAATYASGFPQAEQVLHDHHALIDAEAMKKSQLQHLLSHSSEKSVVSCVSSGSAAILCEQGDCLPPDACVWVQGKEEPVPLTKVQKGMQILTVQHSAGNPVAFAPVQNISITAVDAAKAPVWLRVELSDGNQAVMTAEHCVLPHSRQEGGTRAQDLVPGVDSLMVMSTRPTLVQSISQLPADEMPASSVWIEVAGCEKTATQGEGGRSLMVCMPKSQPVGSFVAVGDAQLMPVPLNAVPKTNTTFSDCTSEGIGARSIPRSGVSNGLAGGHWNLQKSDGMGLPDQPAAIPMQTCWGKPSSSSFALDERHYLQVKNTFFDVVSQGGSGSDKSNDNPKPILSWTDERAGLIYGSYPKSPERKAPSARSASLSARSSSMSGISSRSRFSDVSSEGVNKAETVVVLGGQTETTSCGEVHMSEFQKVPRHPVTGELTSIGSVGHFCGNCKPCEWMQRGRPCKYGWRCSYCHIVDEHARYSRKSRQSQSMGSSKQQISSSSSRGAGPLSGTPNRGLYTLQL